MRLRPSSIIAPDVWWLEVACCHSSHGSGMLRRHWVEGAEIGRLRNGELASNLVVSYQSETSMVWETRKAGS